jgi:hypothetical protein
MSILSRILNVATGGISGSIFGVGGSSKKKKEPTINDLLAPYLKQYSDVATKYSGEADQDYNKATVGYDNAMKYYQDILNGSRENLLKTVDASGATAALDEQERQNYELAPRGGRRAATASNLEFSKMGELNKLLQYLRGQAPGQIANIAQAFANMGQGKLAAAMGGTAGGTGIILNEEQIRQQEKDRKANLIGSILGAAGSVLGAFACNTLDTWVYTPKGYKQLAELNVGDKVYTLGPNEKLEEAKIIRRDIKEAQEIWELTCNDTCLKGTLSHVIAGMNDTEYSFQDLAEVLTTLPAFKNDELFITTMKSFKKKKNKEDVVILKLNNEKKNFNYITNGLISIDADCKV